MSISHPNTKRHGAVSAKRAAAVVTPHGAIPRFLVPKLCLATHLSSKLCFAGISTAIGSRSRSLCSGLRSSSFLFFLQRGFECCLPFGDERLVAGSVEE